MFNKYGKRNPDHLSFDLCVHLSTVRFSAQRCGAASRWRDKRGRGDVTVGVRRACGCVVARPLLWALCCVCRASIHPLSESTKLWIRAGWRRKKQDATTATTPRERTKPRAERHTPPPYEPTNTDFPADCDSRQNKSPPALCIRRFCHCNHHLGGRGTLKNLACGGHSPTFVPCPRHTCGHTRATPGRRVEGL